MKNCRLIGRIVAAFIVMGISNFSIAEVISKEVNYDVDGTTFTGYFAYDNEIEGERPGVLVVHEWWGHNDYARQRADMLAEMGYAAFALDMYGSGKLAEHPDTAKAFMTAVVSQPEQAVKRFDAATELLKQQSVVRDDSIAAIGYCFGGAVVLNMARAGKDLKGVVSFHGSLGTQSPAQPGDITAKIQVYNGADDPFVPAEQVEGFKKEMDAADVDYKLVNFAGAQHSFTNPGADKVAEQFGMPLAYDQSADETSWTGMQEFFEAIFAR